jgi:hypothetical protein
VEDLEVVALRVVEVRRAAPVVPAFGEELDPARA